MRLVIAPLLAALLLSAPRASAVEPAAIGTGQKIDVQWSVVGVIGTVAVVKNNATKATYSLQIGDALPTQFGFTLKAVQGRKVVVTDGTQDVTLSFAEASAPAAEEDQAGLTARFIDNYYRGLAETAGFPEEAPREGESGLGLPLRRFGPFKENDGRSRFELYRTDRPYRQGADGDGTAQGDGESEDGRFVVNYDNFEDLPQAESPGQGMSFDDWIDAAGDNPPEAITE